MTSETSQEDRIIAQRLIGRLLVWRDQLFERLQLLSRGCRLPDGSPDAEDGRIPMDPADWKRLLRESIDVLERGAKDSDISFEACRSADERLHALLPDEKTLFAVYNEAWDVMELIREVFAPDEHEYLALCGDVMADMVLIDRIAEYLEIPD